MANLAITRRCLRGCAYCFAADERAGGTLMDMPLDVFERALDFLERSGVRDARLLGGEPLLHPVFGTLARRALERGFSLTVMTGGQVPERALAELAALAGSIPPERMTVFLNAAIPGHDVPALVQVQERLLGLIGPRVELGVTLLAKDFGNDYQPGRGIVLADVLLDRIVRYGVRPAIRLGIAHPVWHGTNVSEPAMGLRLLGPVVEALAVRVEAAHVRVGFDCGLVPCMFSAAFAEGYPHLMAQTGIRCGPVIDVLPEGDTIACFALSHGWHGMLDSVVTRAECGAAFEEWFAKQPQTWVFDECETCADRVAGRCGGGCRARRLAHTEHGFSVAVSAAGTSGCGTGKAR